MKALFIFLMVIVASAVVLSQPNNDQNMYRLAQAFEQQGDHERALELYRSLYARDPNNYPYFDALRRTFVQLKKYDDAINLSRERLRLLPFDFNLQANIGSLYSMSGRERQSDSVWNHILVSSNKNPMIVRAVAAEQTNQRLFDKAIATYLRGRREIGDPYVFANEMGYLYSFMMDYESAAKEFLLMLRQNEQQYDFIQTRLAGIISKTDGLRAVTNIVESEVKQRQTIPLLRLQLWLYMEDKKFSDAFDIAQTIEKLLNSGGVEIFQFAERLVREHEYDVASRAYRLALQKNLPMQYRQSARFGFARCVEELSSGGDTTVSRNSISTSTLPETQPSFSGAIDLYASVAKDFPYTAAAANALYRIGMIRYKQLYDLDGALQVFDSVLTVAPAGSMVADILSAIGDIYVAQNKLEAAVKKYTVISHTSHSSQEQKDRALYRLAEIQYFMNAMDSALSLLLPLTRKLKADETNDALLLQYFITENSFQHRDALKQYARAELLALQNRLGDAVTEMLSLIDLYPAAPLADDAVMTAASYLTKLQRYNDALMLYNKLFDEFKSSTEKEKAYFKIGELHHRYLNDPQKAITAYGMILEKYPFSLFAEEARKRIRLLRGDSI
ncbi:MAG: tetratricopeptide repeat protein [Bacteroidota bacterium]